MDKSKLISLTWLLLTSTLTTASAQAEHADFMRSIGKIYVVVGVIVIVFIGIIAFLFYLERKVTKLENQISKNE